MRHEYVHPNSCQIFVLLEDKKKKKNLNPAPAAFMLHPLCSCLPTD